MAIPLAGMYGVGCGTSCVYVRVALAMRTPPVNQPHEEDFRVEVHNHGRPVTATVQNGSF